MYSQKKRSLVILCTALCLALSLFGCAEESPAVSESDVSSDVSSEAADNLTAEEAVSVCRSDGGEIEFFLLESSWNGEEYSGSSLNLLMTEKYLSNEDSIPTAENSSTMVFKFNTQVNPNSVVLTRYGNTFTANTGLPHDESQIALTLDDDGNYCFTVSFDSFNLYYYSLECSWSDGNSATYCFALSKA